ncbi:MAG: hypothetical protein J6B95_00790 [Oscillospiraceae bacterium]|nr:hypothetical protein [Oscillospiraceae bacterium]
MGIESVESADTVTAIGSGDFCGDALEMGTNCFGEAPITVYCPQENDAWTQEILDFPRDVVEPVSDQWAAGDFAGCNIRKGLSFFE